MSAWQVSMVIELEAGAFQEYHTVWFPSQSPASFRSEVLWSGSPASLVAPSVVPETEAPPPAPICRAYGKVSLWLVQCPSKDFPAEGRCPRVALRRTQSDVDAQNNRSLGVHHTYQMV